MKINTKDIKTKPVEIKERYNKCGRLKIAVIGIYITGINMIKGSAKTN